MLSLHSSFDVFVRSNGDTRYIIVVSDGATYWYTPGRGWAKSSLKGIPAGKKITLISGFHKYRQGTRYVAVLNDGSVYWYTPGHGWAASSMKGFPRL